MAMMKRVFLFALINILILIPLTIAFNLLVPVFVGPDSGLQGYYTTVLLFALVFGMGGAFISLFMSKPMTKRMMGVQVINPEKPTRGAAELVATVHRLARDARLPKMPEVGVYDSPEVNAFATGPSKSNSMVAVSTGLLNRMGKDEVEGVLAHEVAHIANGDMVTMTLVQGIVNTFVLFFSRIIANIVASNMDEKMSTFAHFGLVIAFQILFGILGSIAVNFFSRAREYRADAGGAKLAGKGKMVAALEALQGTLPSAGHHDEGLQTMKISGANKSALAALFSTHPPLEARIRRLQAAAY